ncbi:MAG TPA: hypothetical protein VEQ59_06250 [Polyangiaceae bacterium]|nr:hypothetical protein [Polyangiaceae bacterium]
MELKIGRDTLLAISAVAWADGSIEPHEAAALRQAAQQLLSESADVAEVERSLSARVTLDEIETVRMNRPVRLFTYATCCWMAEIGGRSTPAEAGTLQLLGDRLGLSALARERAQNVVRGIAQRSAPGSFDLLELRSRLSAGLSQIGDE